jgi:hypothetical protein
MIVIEAQVLLTNHSVRAKGLARQGTQARAFTCSQRASEQSFI